MHQKPLQMDDEMKPRIPALMETETLGCLTHTAACLHLLSVLESAAIPTGPKMEGRKAQATFWKGQTYSFRKICHEPHSFHTVA